MLGTLWLMFVFFARLYEGRFENHNWSDLILRCREYTFYLHRVVLGPQSDFFANLLHPDSPIGVCLPAPFFSLVVVSAFVGVWGK